VKHPLISRRPLWLAAALAGAAALAAGLAVATSEHARAGSAYAKWAWDEQPGLPAAASEVAEASAASAGLDSAALRQLAALDTAAGSYRLVALADPVARQVCFALDAGLFASSFHCIGDRAVGGEAIVRFFAGGGASTSVTDHAALLGVARADVVRVVATLADGSKRTLPLGRWRTFAYAASDQGSFPVTLDAYGAGRRLLQTVELSAASPPGSASED